MKAKLNEVAKREKAMKILADVYSCLKVTFKINVDNLDSDIMVKVLVNHFELDFNPDFSYLENIYGVCYSIHSNPLKYFNFSYKKPNR